ncbi:phage tail sheath C-terminal domain-containing protein [Cronobacter muytjensii]|uniref:phage tail sheath C-terminal domain-containing protein n=1 Tax=Cronobacter muytjensii TaxID=413501 RepID=UPI002DBF6D65|nr:phage tail sheath C-terminal domain-containing protein [Cronobacter muytjensii]MEB8638662.1 phage tail sheath C-terminal domain-containing protein [Cronobacter muytjensii]
MDLHGVKTIEYDDGSQYIQTVDVSVIGLVGTAPAAAAGADASLTVGTPLAYNEIKFIAQGQGAAGNSWTVEIVYDDTITTANAIAEYTDRADGGRHLRVRTTTPDAEAGNAAADVQASVELLNTTATGAKLTAIATPATVSGIVYELPPTALSGGTAEPFPLNTPVVIAGSRKKADLLGASGTLQADVFDILNQTGALIVVVRVEADTDATKQQTNILNGINALATAGQVVNVTPRILICPQFSTDDKVGKQLEVVANKLRAVTYLDNYTKTYLPDLSDRRRKYGGRVEMLRPGVFTTNGTDVRPYSATAAGLRARIDNELGWWWSKSNQEIYGVTEIKPVDDFIIGDATCTANLLNQDLISTIIRYNGYRHWGNRLCNTAPQWGFECVRRSADVIEDSIAEAMMDFIDRPIDYYLGEDLINTIASYLRTLKDMGAINGGKAWLDPDLNTKESLAAGKVYINVEFAPKSPAETITVTYRINNDYTVEQFLQAA